MPPVPPPGHHRARSGLYAAADLSRPLDFDARVAVPAVPQAKHSRDQSYRRRAQPFSRAPSYDDQGDFDMDWRHSHRAVPRPPSARKHSLKDLRDARWARARAMLIRHTCAHARTREAATLRLLQQRAAALHQPHRTCSECVVLPAKVLLITMESSFEAPVKYQICLRSQAPCARQPAIALQDGYFPATPVRSPVVATDSGSIPVWICTRLLRFCEYLQYESKHETSITALASALARSQRAACPVSGQHGDIRIVHLDEASLARRLRHALQEWRHISLSVDQLVLNAMHPRDEPGHMLRACPVCVEGLDESLYPEPPDLLAPGAQQDESREPDEAVHHFSKAHGDGNMKIRHFASRGNNERYREREDKLPLEVMIPDSRRDVLDESIRAQLPKRSQVARGCHLFQADKRVFNVACDHGIVICGVNMSGGENWRYSAMCMNMIITAASVPRAYFLDINCVWQHYYQNLVSQNDDWPEAIKSAARKVAYPLPPFHTHMHSAACRAQYGLGNERFAKDLMSIGEPVEQHWASLGRGLALRYMTLDGHTLAVEAAIRYHNSVRDARVGNLLRKRLKDLIRLRDCALSLLAELPADAMQARASPPRPFPSARIDDALIVVALRCEIIALSAAGGPVPLDLISSRTSGATEKYIRQLRNKESALSKDLPAASPALLPADDEGFLVLVVELAEQKMIAAASDALDAASCMLAIRYGLMKLSNAAQKPASLSKRARRQTGIARNKLAQAFQWALVAHALSQALDPVNLGTSGAWLDNLWLEQHLFAQDADCKTAVEVALQELLGKEVTDGVIDRGMKIPGDLKFLQGEDTAAQLALQSAKTLLRDIDRLAGERVHRCREYAALLVGRQRRIDRLTAAASAAEVPGLEHILQQRARVERAVLHEDRLKAPSLDAAAFASACPVAAGDVAASVDDLLSFRQGGAHGALDGSDDDSSTGSEEENLDAGALVHEHALHQRADDSYADLPDTPYPSPLVIDSDDSGVAVVNDDDDVVEVARHQGQAQPVSFRALTVTVAEAQLDHLHDELICQVSCGLLALPLYGRHMQALEPQAWLTCDIVIAHCIMLQGACNRRGDLPRVAVLHTEFGVVLERSDDIKSALRYDKPGAKTWEARLGPGSTLQDVDLLMFPVHRPDHWVCAAIDLRANVLMYFDSLPGNTAPRQAGSLLQKLALFVTCALPERSKDFSIVSNVRPYISTSPGGGISITQRARIGSFKQSNHWDCGCHCVIMLRVLAAYAAHASSHSTWAALALPSSPDEARDAAWRAQIAAECLALGVQLPGEEGAPVLYEGEPA